MNHVNSYNRKNLGDKMPYQAVSTLCREDQLKKMNIELIHHDEFTLHSSLLK